MKNIHVLPTDKGTGSLAKSPNTKYYVVSDHNRGISDHIDYNIYITNDENPKAGEWSLYRGKIHKCIENIVGDEFKKIILTTDQDLIKDGVQAIDETFLEWYVKNPSCEEVEVEKQRICENCGVEDCNNFRCRGYDNVLRYEIVFPQEEPKQEWNPTQGEEVWIKVFSNWSKGTYIGYDVAKQTHIVREEEKGGGHLFSSTEVLPYHAMPNEPKQETLKKVEENIDREEWIHFFKNNSKEEILEYLINYKFPL